LAGWAPRQVSPLGLRPRKRMTTGRRRTRHGAMGSPHPAGGIRTPFPTLSPQGSPRGPFPRRPTSGPGFPRVWSAVEGGCPLQRRVWCRASQDIPPARGSPGRGGRWRPPVLTSGPGTTREVGLPPPYRAGPAGSRPRAQGNLNKRTPTAIHHLQPWAFLARAPLTRPRPRDRLPLRRTTCRREKRTKGPPHHPPSPA
jgi:hypothetical protein